MFSCSFHHQTLFTSWPRPGLVRVEFEEFYCTLKSCLTKILVYARQLWAQFQFSVNNLYIPLFIPPEIQRKLFSAFSPNKCCELKHINTIIQYLGVTYALFLIFQSHIQKIAAKVISMTRKLLDHLRNLLRHKYCCVPQPRPWLPLLLSIVLRFGWTEQCTLYWALRLSLMAPSCLQWGVQQLAKLFLIYAPKTFYIKCSQFLFKTKIHTNRTKHKNLDKKKTKLRS